MFQWPHEQQPSCSGISLTQVVTTQFSPFSPCLCFCIHTCVHGTPVHSLLSVKCGLYSCLHFFLIFFKAFQSKSFQIESLWLVPWGLWVSNDCCAQPPSYCPGVFMPTKPHREQWLLTPRHSCPSTEIGSYHKS